ncbi:MAG TPA: phage portal protein [Kribbellaceae bacterium]|nr:phage portal protein [Kribbellaceae bacterium]
MSFWSWLLHGSPAGETANANPPSSVGPPGYEPGDPHGFEFDPPPGGVNTRFAQLVPSPWSGWPAEWSTPAFNQKAGPLVDTAWACLDLNASILSSMPVYLTRGGEILPSKTWMTNPDPTIYASWAEFAKQLFWDYQMGEAFVLPMARTADGWPYNFRVVPPWLVNVEMGKGRRVYSIGQADVTDDILHIRYKSTTDSARGVGPLEAGGPRAVAAGLLVKLVGSIAEQGGLPPYFLTTEQRLNREQARDQLDEYVDSRIRNSGRPALLSFGVKPSTLTMSVKDMTLLELGQWTESRIAILLGVPPFLVGLPSGGDSMTYSNVTSLFEFHHRSSLNAKAVHVMQALSGWAVPRGTSVELNRDEYTRPPLTERAEAYSKLVTIGALSADEVRTMERFTGDAPDLDESEQDNLAPTALTGGDV